jgi:predicted amidohydrolase YtcJ
MYPKADTILSGGRVWLGRQEGFAEAIALWGGRVLASGTAAEIDGLRGPDTKVIRLHGRLATPGLIEAHIHLLPLGLVMAELDLRVEAAPTLDALLGAIAAQARRSKPGEWILGRGYDHNRLDVKRHPHRTELDAVAPQNPVYIVRACGHVSVVNSRALELAGVTIDTPVPQGGLIEQANGQLTGLLAETGRDPIKAVMPQATDEELIAAIERAGRACAAYGITACMDAAVGMRAGYREMIAYRRARLAGRLPIRVNQCLLGGPGGILERCHAEGLVTGAGDDWLRVGPVKIFTDGSAGGRTAAMSRPYLGEPETSGLFLLNDAEMDALTLDYHAKGYQLAVHAIGDAAIEQTLVAMEKALAAHPDPDRRHRIEHCGFTTPDQMRRMRTAGIAPAPQPVFIRDFGDLYVKVAGETRAHASYPARDWIDAGFEVSISTDAPVCDVNPFANIHAALTRRTRDGNVIGAGQVISPAEALHGYTGAAAWANRADTQLGSLRPGLAGDITVFNLDLFEAEPDAILSGARADLTIIAGECVAGER